MVFTVKSLTDICLRSIIHIIEESRFNHKVINDFCKVIPSHLLDSVFDILQEKRIVTDVTLMLFLIPSRRKLSLTSSNHLRNSTLKQIGINCPFLRELDLSDCVQVSNTVVRIVLQGE